MDNTSRNVNINEETVKAAPDGPGRDRLRSIIERLPDGIVVVDGTGNIQFANPAAEKLFGRSASELLGTPFGFPIVAGETTEIDIVQRGGASVVFAELRVVDTEWEGQRVELVSLRDCTDRKHAEERAKQLAREREARLDAEATSKAKSEFLAIMSHELRTPLNAVLGYSELLELGIHGNLTDQQREQLGRIRASGKHLLVLVNEVLDLAKVESGRLSVRCAPALASDAIKYSVSLIEPQAAARGVEIKAPQSFSGRLAYAGDEERVRQILINLLSNAVKFTPAGGKISVDATTTSEAGGAARLQPRRCYVAMSVTDTGPGIPENKLTAIFDPFVQAESGHTRTTEGSGLGLTISRRLARLMGGDLTVRSTPGNGSTFTLWVPAVAESELGEGAVLPPPSTQVAPIRTELLDKVALTLLSSIVQMTDAIVNSIRSDASLSQATGLKFTQVADHLVAFLADIGSSLLVIEEWGGRPSPLLADATEIQRLIAEKHGAQRAQLGWSESALRREFMIIREEIESVVREALTGNASVMIDDAVAIIGRFLDQAEYVAVRTLGAAPSG